MKRLLASTCLALAAAAVSATASAAAPVDAPACQTVRLASPGWADIDATNALAGAVLKGLGYRPAVQTLSVPVTYQGLKSGQVDVFLGNWMPAQRELTEPFFRQGQVERLATNLDKARFTLAVPDYVAKAGVRSFADLQAHADKFGKRFYGIEPGAPANQILRQMIAGKAYGLSGWTLVESGDAALLAQLERSFKSDAKPWMVFLAWEPHVINTRFPITYLQGGDAHFGPDYGAATVSTVSRKGYAAQCPNLGRLFGQLRFSVALENEMLKQTVGERVEPGQAALALIKRHPELLDGWLKGVVTSQGGDGLAAVRHSLGLPPR
ncbi:choline ABC transporter substrate-binding protein [Zoogloea sp. LCSB751]|uniref:choline ABC transporter substrate-binding protein n=1 Tax=Zoogloea sp. LCSB751 TaxID=1965277 RepID=UPI0009A493CB|nr:choline ABC transporter substrate-binding protein [Zoogloea sp. LCSB751]